MLPKPPNGYLAEPQADQQLREFVHVGKYDFPRLPKRADPAQADKFMKKTLEDKDLRIKALGQCWALMRFYDLRARAGQLTQWLDRDQARDHFGRSVTATALAGAFGDDQLQQQAVTHYQLLVGHRLAPGFFPELIDCLFHLPDGADPQGITAALDQRLQALQPKMAADEDAAVEYNRIADLKSDRLAAVLSAKQRKEDILRIKDAERRRFEVARCYLGFEPNGYIDLSAWGVLMLQRDCRDDDPPPLAATLAHALDMIISRGSSKQGMTPRDEKDLNIYVTRCRRAVEFYLGKLNDKQQAFADQHDNAEQNDVLYWEPEETKPAG